jgi:hypothetical protein
MSTSQRASKMPSTLCISVLSSPSWLEVSIKVRNASILEFPFDGEFHPVQATFVETQRVLIGTRLLRNYRLTIDFPAGTLLLERVETIP